MGSRDGENPVGESREGGIEDFRLSQLDLWLVGWIRERQGSGGGGKRSRREESKENQECNGGFGKKSQIF